MADNDLYNLGALLQCHLLDLLIDGPSSFAALYGALIRHCGYPDTLEVPLVLNALLEMEQQGWVKALQIDEEGYFHVPTDEDRKNNLYAYCMWLPRASFEELSLDEIGLWYELTSEGRARWEGLPDDSVNSLRQWKLDDSSDTSTIVIQAANTEIAKEALRFWLFYNPKINIVNGSMTIEPISDLSLSNGTKIINGVKVSWRYQLTPH